MAVRMAVVAGRFYEASQSGCEGQIKAMVPKTAVEIPFDGPIVAGVVPHAGWMFSGNLAALVFGAVQRRQEVDTFVVFGAVHSAAGGLAMLYDAGQWVAFPTERQALAVAYRDDAPGPRRNVEETTFGAILDDNPKNLVHMYGQFYWAEDLA